MLLILCYEGGKNEDKVKYYPNPTPGSLTQNHFIPEILCTCSFSFIGEPEPVPQTVDGAARHLSSHILCHNGKDKD